MARVMCLINLISRSYIFKIQPNQLVLSSKKNKLLSKVCTVSGLPVFKMQAGHVPYPAASYHTQNISLNLVCSFVSVCIRAYVWLFCCVWALSCWVPVVYVL